MEHQLDSGDLDAIREVRGLPGQALIQIRTTDEIRRATEELIRFGEDGKTNFLRGKIEGLRIALNIPEIIEAEAKEAVQPVKRTHGR